MEKWAAVIGFEGLYEVSDLGRVKSLRREIIHEDGAKRTLSERILLAKPHTGTGYCFVTLYRDKVAHKLRVHLLVLHSFIGQKPEGFDGCHNDGDKTNNRLDNLRYDTRSGNLMDRVLHGTSNRGEAHGMAVLTTDKVLAIREDCRSQKCIASDYGISQIHVSQIKRRRSWAWL